MAFCSWTCFQEATSCSAFIAIILGPRSTLLLTCSTAGATAKPSSLSLSILKHSIHIPWALQYLSIELYKEKTKLFPKVAAPLLVFVSCVRGLCLPWASPHLTWSAFGFSHFKGVRWHVIVVLTCVFLVTHAVDHLSRVCHLPPSLVECLFICFGHF